MFFFHPHLPFAYFLDLGFKRLSLEEDHEHRFMGSKTLETYKECYIQVFKIQICLTLKCGCKKQTNCHHFFFSSFVLILAWKFHFTVLKVHPITYFPSPPHPPPPLTSSYIRHFLYGPDDVQRMQKNVAPFTPSPSFEEGSSKYHAPPLKYQNTYSRCVQRYPCVRLETFRYPCVQRYPCAAQRRC